MNTGCCLRTTEADSFAVWLVLGNITHGEANKATIFFEKSAVGVLDCLAMGFAWYIEAPAPAGVPEGQWSAIPTPHAHGTGGRSGLGLLWFGTGRRERGEEKHSRE